MDPVTYTYDMGKRITFDHRDVWPGRADGEPKREAGPGPEGGKPVPGYAYPGDAALLPPFRFEHDPTARVFRLRRPTARSRC